MGSYTRPELRARIGDRWLPLNHAEAISAVAGLELVALCDLNPENLARAQADHGVQAGYASYLEMLRAERPDIVTIATRTAERPDILIAAAEAGVRGIHSEKPLSNNLGDAIRVANALRNRNVAFTYGTLRRYMPVYEEAHAALRSGVIGELQTVVIRMGAAALLWMHPHSIDLLCRYAGTSRARRVQSLLEFPKDTLSGKTIDADPIVISGLVEFENGITGVITAANGRDVELMGADGQITVQDNGSCWWTSGSARTGGPITVNSPANATAPAVIAMQELRDQVNQGYVSRLTIDEIVEQQRLLFAMVESHLRNGAAVDPGDVDTQFTVTGKIQGLYA
jgi:predicted dehydrogenase